MKTIRQFLALNESFLRQEYQRLQPIQHTDKKEEEKLLKQKPSHFQNHPFHKQVTDAGYQYYGTLKHDDATGAITHTYTHPVASNKKPVIHLSSWKYEEKGGETKTQHSWAVTKGGAGVTGFKQLSQVHNKALHIGSDDKNLGKFLARPAGLRSKEPTADRAAEHPLVKQALERGYKLQKSSVKVPNKTQDTAGTIPDHGVKRSPKPKFDKETTYDLKHPEHGDLSVKTTEKGDQVSHSFTNLASIAPKPRFEPRISGTTPTKFKQFLRGKRDRDKLLDKQFLERFRKRSAEGFYEPRDFTKF